MASLHRLLAGLLLICALASLSGANDPLEPEDEGAPVVVAAPDDLDIFLVDETNSTGNVTRDCRRARPDSLTCPDEDIIFYLYSGANPVRETIDVTDPEWFGRSKFDKSLPTVLLVHGYRGGDSLMPLVILKDAYTKKGTHNVIMADWGPLSKASCYAQAVGSLRAVGKCAGYMLKYFADNGVITENVTCVGHSLGAHICGILSDGYMSKKLERIVALDPARPLMGARRPNARLNAGDAKSVQVIHTNAGFYGEPGRGGTVDFCVNSGRIQPFCEKAKNEQLCSHLESVCFYAQSLDKDKALRGQPCNARCPVRLPALTGPAQASAQEADKSAIMGEFLDPSTEGGMYCVKAPDVPFCPSSRTDEKYGDPRCCPKTDPNNPRRRLRGRRVLASLISESGILSALPKLRKN